MSENYLSGSIEKKISTKNDHQSLEKILYKMV